MLIFLQLTKMHTLLEFCTVTLALEISSFMMTMDGLSTGTCRSQCPPMQKLKPPLVYLVQVLFCSCTFLTFTSYSPISWGSSYVLFYLLLVKNPLYPFNIAVQIFNISFVSLWLVGIKCCGSYCYLSLSNIVQVLPIIVPYLFILLIITI